MASESREGMYIESKLLRRMGNFTFGESTHPACKVRTYALSPYALSPYVGILLVFYRYYFEIQLC